MFSDLLVYLQGQLYQFPFFFKSNSPYDGFICLEMVGNRSCRPQPVANIEEFNFLL